MGRKAVLVGGSGLIGNNLLNILLYGDFYDKVLVLVRKKIPLNHKKLEQLIVDFDDLSASGSLIIGDVVFCCLGSTKAKTPDLKEYRKVDHDYPLELAKIAFKNRIKQYHLVSSIGANTSSSNFYTKMKGQTESDIKKVRLTCLQIYQPSVLEGDRNELRKLERGTIRLMKIINPLLIGFLKKYRSIPALTVAKAMYKQSIKKESGVYTWTSDKIKELS